MTRRFLCALVVGGAALANRAFANETNSGQWLIDFQSDGRIQLTLHQDHHENSFPVPLDAFRGLSRSATHFEFVRDAGSFVCDGRFAGDHGAGTFVFAADPKYISEMKSLGYSIDSDRAMEMAAFDISRAFVQDLKGLGYHGLPLDDLLRFRIHGVTINYIRDFQSAGYSSLGAEELVHMRIHGVSIEFVRALETYGYQRIAPEDLIRMRIHGVSPAFIRDLKAEGYTGVPVEELIRMQIHGVTPEMVRKVQSAGFAHPTTDQLVQMRIHGLVD
jgi:hypothetical protein